MNIAAAVVTTFGNSSWKIYAQAMLTNFVKFWPKEIPIMVNLDNDLLDMDVKKLLRPQDGFVSGWEKEHNDFVERNRDRDDKTNYRKQSVRFCHKVFALKFALDAATRARIAKAEDAPRYLIWLDADVVTTSPVTFDDLVKCLPKEGDAVSYMGRKDWDHSECGWLAFDLNHDGGKIIEDMYLAYRTDGIFQFEQWHDSYVFDKTIANLGFKATNLTEDKPGMDIWQHSPMATFSTHHKGPVAKDMLQKPLQQGQPLRIQTKNSVEDKSIQQNILENQAQITNWVRTCVAHADEAVLVSAGPMLVAEDLLSETAKIFAVKHALEPLKAAGITPYACILLDPREHVADFVKEPDRNVIWFVASQVSPKVVRTLLEAGCVVWGYHASVGAGEGHLTERQHEAVIHGGSATATRGMFLLEALGFRHFKLYGYDLCLPVKPDLNEKDEQGQPKNFEVTILAEKPNYKNKRSFWSKGELLAQYQEIIDIITKQPWNVRAYGNGIVPFLLEAERVSNLREKRKRAKLGDYTPVFYEDLLGCKKKTPSWVKWLRKRLTALHRQRKASNF